MARPLPPGNGGGPIRPPYKPPVGKSPISGSPGLLTSTGGLSGTKFQVLMPLFDFVFNNSYCALIDGDNANSEEDGFYYFPEEDVLGGRNCSVHKIVFWYREIGAATFYFGIRWFNEKMDIFESLEKKVVIQSRTGEKPSTFPDGNLHIRRISFVISGQKPQLYLRRIKDGGPFSITRAMMVGKADEKEIL